MKRTVAALAFTVSLILCLTGCLTAQTKAPEEASKASEPAKADAPPAKAPENKVVVEAVKPTPPTPAPQAPKLSVEELQARRQMEKELERDIGDYYALVKDRNVEKAVEMAPTDKQEALQTQLWQFIADFSVESFDLTDKKIDYAAKPPKANVNIVLTVYEARSVTPKKTPVSSQWLYNGGHWYILPTP